VMRLSQGNVEDAAKGGRLASITMRPSGIESISER
jgi:hypothetical protein